uniref:GH18 domain-containing protein n=1 Tax=Mola mola TaxID=94237 RepID=A0A3Q4B4R5_MOLML
MLLANLQAALIFFGNFIPKTNFLLLFLFVFWAFCSLCKSLRIGFANNCEQVKLVSLPLPCCPASASSRKQVCHMTNQAQYCTVEWNDEQSSIKLSDFKELMWFWIIFPEELSKAFEDDARDNRKTQLLLSVNVDGILFTIERAYEANKISLLDFINVTTYDIHEHCESITGHNSPLYCSSVNKGSHVHHIILSVSYWLGLGAPAEKLLLGFPTYGRTYHLNSGVTGLGAPTNGPADAGPYTLTAGVWICDFIQTTTVEWLSEQEVPYATDGSLWLGYDDMLSYSSKVQWMTANNLGGVHVWTLDMDDFGGTFCSAGDYPLVNHLRTSMGFPQSPPPPPPLVDFCHGHREGLYENPTIFFVHRSCGSSYLHNCKRTLCYYHLA